MISIGIDIGGTGIQVGAVNDKYEIVARNQIVTRTDIPFEDQVKSIADCVLEMLSCPGAPSLGEVASIGVGIPGLADREGNIVFCPNMGWKNVPFRRIFTKYIDKPVFIDNDANVAALGESKAGVCAGTSSSVFITLGTGIGSGIIINGKIWNGAHGIGGELGHTILKTYGIPCTCGSRGCTERYCSATAIIREARKAAAEHPETAILAKAGGDPRKINAKCVFDAAKENDPVAVAIFNQYVSMLAQTISNVVNFLDPEVIVLGGGVSKAGDFLLDAVRAAFPKHVIFNTRIMPEVKLAILGPDAGIIGAALLS